MRRSYMTLSFMDDTEVTYVVNNGVIEVTFERAVNKGFYEAVFNQYGTLLKNRGFNNAELAIFKDIAIRGVPVMIRELRGEFDA